MCASHGVLRNPQGKVKVKAVSTSAEVGSGFMVGAPPARFICFQRSDARAYTLGPERW